MVSVSYELARKIATEVVSRVNARFPEVRVDVHGPTELAHGVFVVISPEDPRAVDAEVFVAYDGTYLLNAGPSFCIESDDFSGNLADVAGQIFAQLGAFGTAGMVEVRRLKWLGPISPTWIGRPGIDDYIDEALLSRSAKVVRSWRPWI